MGERGPKKLFPKQIGIRLDDDRAAALAAWMRENRVFVISDAIRQAVDQLTGYTPRTPSPDKD